MKCPKCGYVSFDYNDSCPRCNKDISTEREKMGQSSFRPKSPEMLRSLLVERGSAAAPGIAAQSQEEDLSMGLEESGSLEELSEAEGFEEGSGTDLTPEDEEDLSLDLDELSEESIEFAPGEDLAAQEPEAPQGGESGKEGGSEFMDEPEEIELELGALDEEKEQ